MHTTIFSVVVLFVFITGICKADKCSVYCPSIDNIKNYSSCSKKCELNQKAICTCDSNGSAKCICVNETTCSKCNIEINKCTPICQYSIEKCAICLGAKFNDCYECFPNATALKSYFNLHHNVTDDNCCEAANGGCCWGASKCSICCPIGTPAICTCADCATYPICDCSTCSSCAHCYCGNNI